MKGGNMTKMTTKIYYSVENCGDGSAYPRWMESEELAELHQKFMDEGWGESCTGWLTIEHDSPIKILNEIKTVDSMIKEIEELGEELINEPWNKSLKGKLIALKKLKERTKKEAT
jgi:hypothetical protein